ncbi:MAG: PilZ domain-containing protein [bacterium]
MPPPGTPLVVVQRTAQPKQWQGELIAFRDATLAARITGGPPSWDSAPAYSLIWGTPGSRSMCNATFVANNGTAAAFRVTSAIKAIDLRRDTRFNLELNAEVRSVLGGSRQQGRLVDISSGGAAVAVESRPGGSQIEIGLQADGYSARLLCEVLSTTTSDSQTILHMRFRDLTPPQQAFVRNLVGRLVEQRAS